MNRLSVKLNELKESPEAKFLFERTTTRKEIAEEISKLLNTNIDPEDYKLTDNFCNQWLISEIEFINETISTEVKKAYKYWLITKLENNGFIIPKNIIENIEKDEIKSQEINTDNIINKENTSFNINNDIT